MMKQRENENLQKIIQMKQILQHKDSVEQLNKENAIIKELKQRLKEVNDQNEQVITIIAKSKEIIQKLKQEKIKLENKHHRLTRELKAKKADNVELSNVLAQIYAWTNHTSDEKNDEPQDTIKI